MKVQIRKKESGETGCLICGKPVLYTEASAVYTCHLCAARHESNAVCENGHYVCDKCHSSAQPDYLRFLRGSGEKDPIKLFRQIAELKSVHMHGPEHHSIVPCVLLTAYRNRGGTIDLDAALKIATKRGGQVPGGTCGYWGACGAAIGAGIYAAIILGSNPLNTRVWSAPQRLTAQCLGRITELGGPRCCKRTSQTAIELAAQFTQEHTGVELPLSHLPCGYHEKNRECIRTRCPYFGGQANAQI